MHVFNKPRISFIRIFCQIMLVVMAISSLGVNTVHAEEKNGIAVTYYIVRRGLVKPAGQTYLNWNGYNRVGYGIIRSETEIYDDPVAVADQIIIKPQAIKLLNENESVQWYTIRKDPSEWRVEGVITGSQAESIVSDKPTTDPVPRGLNEAAHSPQPAAPVSLENQENAIYYILKDNLIRPQGDTAYIRYYYYDEVGYGTVVTPGNVYDNSAIVNSSLRTVPDYNSITTAVEWYAIRKEDNVWRVYGQKINDVGAAKAYPATFYLRVRGENFPVEESTVTWKSYTRVGYGSIEEPTLLNNDITAVESRLKMIPDLSKYVSDGDSVKWYAVKTENGGWRVDGVLNSEIIRNEKERLEREALLKEAQKKKTNFIHTAGTKIYNQNGSEFQIRSIGFGNNVWYTQKGLPLTDHDEKSYEELASLGFNSVRFYLNASLFETSPYTYSEEAFAWLDQNIEWAKRNSIKILLNMHIPQGGQLNSGNVALWVKDGYKERLAALWLKIAERYSSNDAILGYGLLNEPFVPELSTADASLKNYYDYMEVLSKTIRSVDSNHMLFVERPYAVVNTNTLRASYIWGYTDSFRKISDNNTVYEFHFYDKNEFVYQGLSWLNYTDKWIYNTDDVAILRGARKVVKNIVANNVSDFDSKSAQWQYVESEPIKIDTPDVNYGYWMIYGSNLGPRSTVNFDDIVVKEYNENGKFVRDLYINGFDKVTNFDGWNMNTGNGKYVYSNTEGHTKAGSASLVGVDKDYRIYLSANETNNFPLKQGYRYKIAAWVKGENVSTAAKVKFSLQTCYADHVFGLNLEYLKYQLDIFVNYAKANNMALYLGEFGVPNQLMGNSYKGEEWVADMFKLIDGYGLGYSYHDYHEENFGLYTNDSRYNRSQKNDTLNQLFKKYVK